MDNRHHHHWEQSTNEMFKMCGWPCSELCEYDMFTNYDHTVGVT